MILLDCLEILKVKIIKCMRVCVCVCVIFVLVLEVLEGVLLNIENDYL